jgi:hypothetical protein
LSGNRQALSASHGQARNGFSADSRLMLDRQWYAGRVLPNAPLRSVLSEASYHKEGLRSSTNNSNLFINYSNILI